MQSLLDQRLRSIERRLADLEIRLRDKGDDRAASYDGRNVAPHKNFERRLGDLEFHFQTYQAIEQMTRNEVGRQSSRVTRLYLRLSTWIEDICRRLESVQHAVFPDLAKEISDIRRIIGDAKNDSEWLDLREANPKPKPQSKSG